MIALLLAAALQAASPAPEAEALGRRLARTGTMATLVPMLVEKDLAELAGEDASLTPAERAGLLAIGRAEGRRNLDRLIAALGHAYAKRLSIADLKLLVAQSEMPATARLRTAQPAVIAEAMGTVGAIDLKALTAAEFCRQTGKMCDRK